MGVATAPPPVTGCLAAPTLLVLPFLQSVTVETPQGTMYEGKRFHRQRVRHGSLLPMRAQLLGFACTGSTQHVSLPLSQITGVSILRAGETMEQALTAVCKDIRLGKILIQTNLDTGEPEVSPAAARHAALRCWHVTKRPSFPPQLHYLRLPKEISEDYVILMDSTVSTGAAAMMAVRVLLVRVWGGGWDAASPGPGWALTSPYAAGP